MGGLSSLFSFLVLAAFGLYLLACNPSTSVGTRWSQRTDIRVGTAKVYVNNVSVHTLQSSSSNSDRPSCLKWYRVRRGDTQWSIAQRFTVNTDKNQWIRSMRWVSRKSQGDADLKEGESICVNWGRSSRSI